MPDRPDGEQVLMRRYSLKRQKLNRDADEWREERLREITECDLCREPSCVIHEISRGTANRVLSLTSVFAQLVLCQPCHDLKVHKGMPVAEQLAWLWARRPGDFDIEAFYSLTARRWPSAHDILKAYRRITTHLLAPGF